MNSTLLHSLIAIACAVYIHVLAMFAIARCFGVRVNLVALGLGPQLFAVGRVSIRLFPFGGFVRMHDNREPGVEAHPDAYDIQSGWVRILIPLGGCAALVLMAVALRGPGGWWSFLHGFQQILIGTLSPGVIGVDLVNSYVRAAEAGGFFAVAGILFAKMAAMQLLPFPVMNGGQILLELLLPHSAAAGPAFLRLQQIGFTALCVVMGVWAWIVYRAAFATISP